MWFHLWPIDKLLNFQTFEIVFFIFTFFFSSLIPLGSKNILCVISVFCNLLGLAFWPSMWYHLVSGPLWIHIQNVIPQLDEIFYMYQVMLADQTFYAFLNFCHLLRHMLNPPLWFWIVYFLKKFSHVLILKLCYLVHKINNSYIFLLNQ